MNQKDFPTSRDIVLLEANSPFPDFMDTPAQKKTINWAPTLLTSKTRVIFKATCLNLQQDLVETLFETGAG